MEFQTRSETNGLKFFKTFKEALAEGEKDNTIWKISFPLESGERIRLTRNTPSGWMVSQMEDELWKTMEKD